VLRFKNGMLTKKIRSRFSHEVGEKVEGCTILEKLVISEPVPSEQRRGIYDYVVEVAPAPVKETKKRSSSRPAARASASATEEDFTRASPEEMGGVIRRLPSR
jgi:hypothetical protein